MCDSDREGSGDSPSLEELERRRALLYRRIGAIRARMERMAAAGILVRSEAPAGTFPSLDSVEETIESLKRENEGLTKALEVLQSQLHRLEARRNELQERIRKLEGEVSGYRAELERRRRLREASLARMEELERENETLRRELDLLSANMEKVRKVLAGLLEFCPSRKGEVRRGAD